MEDVNVCLCLRGGSFSFVCRVFPAGRQGSVLRSEVRDVFNKTQRHTPTTFQNNNNNNNNNNHHHCCPRLRLFPVTGGGRRLSNEPARRPRSRANPSRSLWESGTIGVFFLVSLPRNCVCHVGLEARRTWRPGGHRRRCFARRAGGLERVVINRIFGMWRGRQTGCRQCCTATPFRCNRKHEKLWLLVIVALHAFDGHLQMRARLCRRRVFFCLSKGGRYHHSQQQVLSEYEKYALGQRGRDRLRRTTEFPRGLKAGSFRLQCYHEQNIAFVLLRGRALTPAPPMPA